MSAAGVSVPFVRRRLPASVGSGLMYLASHNPQAGFFQGISVNWATKVLALLLAGFVGCVAALVPSYHASRVDIVEGLRYIG